MQTNRIFVAICAAGACAAWAFSVSLFGSIVSDATKARQPAAFATEAGFSASFALVEKALGMQPPIASAPYTGGFESPFRLVSEARMSDMAGEHHTAPVPNRPRLVLKGILYKSSPLAILEDSGGKTSILGVGDTISGQTVAGIGKTSVTLRDKRGTYELSVKE
jgi:hypothetical protein